MAAAIRAPGALAAARRRTLTALAVEELARQFEAAGAKTVIVRKDDESTPLPVRVRRGHRRERRRFGSASTPTPPATERGYLSVSGTSTYYKWSFCRDLADAIHARLLDMTKLPDFGNVGNFNYYPLRANTWMPSMLVEQAFMSNPEDEAKLLDPVFRKEMMRAVVLGTEDWLKRLRAEPEA